MESGALEPIQPSLLCFYIFPNDSTHLGANILPLNFGFFSSSLDSSLLLARKR